MRITSLICVAVCVCWTSPTRHSAATADTAIVTPLTVFSANILYCNPLAESLNSYLNRRTKLAALLARLKPDVIALQEASRCHIFGHNGQTISNLLADLRRSGLRYAAKFWRSERIGLLWEEGLALLWNTARVDLNDSDITCIHLKHSYRRFGVQIRKSLCKALIRPRFAGISLTLFNTHLDSRHASVRTQQAHEVARTVANWMQPGQPAILVGDFNDSSLSGLFVAHGWQVAIRDKIDFIFGRNFPDSARAKTRRMPLRKMGISDHNGLLVEIFQSRKTKAPQISSR